MAINHPEGRPSGIEIETPDALTEACRQLAEGSYRFVMGEVTETKLAYKIVDRNGTTYTYSFHAEYSLDHDGNIYTLEMGVSHQLDQMPQELAELIKQKGDSLPDPERVAGIEAEYDLMLALLPGNELQWDEARTYDVWKVSNEDLGLPPTTDPEPDYTHYTKTLDSTIIDDRLDANSDNEAEEELDDTARFNREFERLIGETTLASVVKDEYFHKAYRLFAACLVGRDADFDPRDYFPEDAAAEITDGRID